MLLTSNNLKNNSLTMAMRPTFGTPVCSAVRPGVSPRLPCVKVDPSCPNTDRYSPLDLIATPLSRDFNEDSNGNQKETKLFTARS